MKNLNIIPFLSVLIGIYLMGNSKKFDHNIVLLIIISICILNLIIMFEKFRSYDKKTRVVKIAILLFFIIITFINCV